MSSSSSNKIADNEMQSVQVFVRIRPALENESPIHSLETTSNDVVVEANYQKKFTFDKVFSEKSTQSHVYNSAVKPFVSDIISGYNCTLVTYGTTFTGKTYTMYGVIPNTATSSGSLENVAIQDSFRIDTHEECGMIPRVVSDLFTELANRQISHSVACTYYQLRNEELCDLLSDDSHQLKIYDDRRNKGAVRIVGLREIYVKNKFELFKLLNKVHQKTIPNEKSGCHSIFTLKTTIHQKGFDCDNYIKIGKLCMVDLASSDNTSKSEVNRRVRDNSRASLSLLTFQRVITALWEKNAHVPFRDSKLTRILQDSFGGKSKTSIITTISPMTGSSDDILCTLECAQRARTIFNKPEVNKMLLFKEFFNHYIDENSSTRKDLEASRNRDGVLIHQENFQKMLTDKKLQKESLSQLRLLVADLKNSKKERKLQTENFLIYVKNVSSDFYADLDYYHKLCNENTQHNELLQSQQLELYNKSKSVLSSCVDKVSARRCVFSNAGDLNICLDKVKQSLNSRSEVFDQVLDLENQRESSLEDFEGCSKGDDCESCKVASESLLEFEESVDDTPVVDNLLFKEIAQENMNGYSETCELEDSLMHLKEKLIQQIKSTYETVITQVMDVKKETLNFESNFENMRSSNNMEMSDLSQEFESYILTILERLKVANDIVDEVVGPTGNSVATHLSKHIEDSERCIANSSKAYIDQKRDLNKIFQDVQNNMLEEHVVAEDFSKGVIDFSQSSIDYNLIVSQITDQLQSIIDNTNAKVEEVQHAGDTPTRPHRKVPHNLKELTPKEKTLHRFRERQELTEAADEDASKDPTGAMSEAED